MYKTYECNLCDYSTRIKSHYYKHTETEKHRNMESLIPGSFLPPTQNERLESENKRLKLMIKRLSDENKMLKEQLNK